MRILLLTGSFNSLAQRLHVELRERGHEVSVELDINDAVSIEAAESFRPHVIVAPILKRRLPAAIWRRWPCWIVHPGIPGDRGPSSLDWAIQEGTERWGVTVLQAAAELDAGPIWSYRLFDLRPARKSSLYRFEVTEAACAAVLEALERFAGGRFEPRTAAQLNPAWPDRWRDPMRQPDRALDWRHDDTAAILRRIRAADGSPGVTDELLGIPCRLFDAHPEDGLTGPPGAAIARREGAVCVATVDGAVWIGHLRATDGHAPPFKLPATQVLGARAGHLPEVPLDPMEPAGRTWRDIRYEEHGPVGVLHFDFYNGAMSTRQCERLLAAYRAACERPTRVLVLAGGSDFWSNGLHLNTIEAADSPADESWRNINAMDDLTEAVIRTTDRLTLAALAGNAGAGGVFLALAADLVCARRGIVLNPHYKNMGNLYGSEYWTYLLPRRSGDETARAVMAERLPLGAEAAQRLGLADRVGPADAAAFAGDTLAHARALAESRDLDQRLADKAQRLAADEARQPLSAYREAELERMRLNFYGFDPSYHVARYRFVHRSPHAWTPRHLALHRRLGWQVPTERDAAAR